MLSISARVKHEENRNEHYPSKKRNGHYIKNNI